MKIPNARSKSYNKMKYDWNRLKYQAKSILVKFPRINSLTVSSSKYLRVLYYKIYMQFLIYMDKAVGTNFESNERNRIYWISPNKIEYSSQVEFSIKHFKGKVLSGDWDILDKPFETIDVYNAIKEVCIEGREWHNTIFYKRIILRLEEGEVLWNCRTKDDFEKRCGYLQELYLAIKNNGYKSREQLIQSGNYRSFKHVDDEITIAVGRHGDLLFCDGAHRLSIAKLLEVKKIPVKVAVRHPEWVRFKKRMRLYTQYQSGTACQPIIHPDLLDIQAFSYYEQIFKEVKKHLSSNRGRFLNIGDDLAYMCHRFESINFDCYAVLNNKYTFDLTKRLRRVEKKNFKIIYDPQLLFNEVKNIFFDVVIIWNLFYIYKYLPRKFAALQDVLTQMQINKLFIYMPHLTKKSSEDRSNYIEFLRALNDIPNSEVFTSPIPC